VTRACRDRREAAVPAAAITAQCVSGQAAARRAVLFLTFPVLAPYLVIVAPPRRESITG
jgi:hypothetical protein